MTLTHLSDFEVVSDLPQTELRKRLCAASGFDWQGRSSEYLGVYTLGRPDPDMKIKIFQPNGGPKFDVEISGPEDTAVVRVQELEQVILKAFEDDPS